MSNTNTGGPAFPHETNSMTHSGMTLRDYFAAKASEEDIEAHIWKGHTEDHVTVDEYGRRSVDRRQARWTRAEARYRYADAMLKAREA